MSLDSPSCVPSCRGKKLTWTRVGVAVGVRIGIHGGRTPRRRLLILLDIQKRKQCSRSRANAEPFTTTRLLLLTAPRARRATVPRAMRASLGEVARGRMATSVALLNNLLSRPLLLLLLPTKDGTEDALGDAAEAQEEEKTDASESANNDTGNSATTEARAAVFLRLLARDEGLARSCTSGSSDPEWCRK